MAGKLGPRETIVYRGYKYGRYPEAAQRDKRVYFHSRARGYLHRVVWTDHNGPIPAGHEIHHVDHDTLNNDPSNLACVPRSEHRRESAESRLVKSYTCDRCAVVFTSQAGATGNHRFCSRACALAFTRLSGRHHIERTCPVCDGTFSTFKYRPATYCSNRCHATTRVRGEGGTFRRL